MDDSGKVKGVDKLVMNGLLIGLLIWVSFLFSNTSGDPGFTIRHIGISCFCLIYSLYFFISKRCSLPALSKISELSILCFSCFILIGVFSSFLAINQNASILPIVTNACFVLLIIIIIHSLQRGLRIAFFAGFLAFIGGLMAFLGILQYYEFLPERLIAGSPPSVLQFNRNFYGSSQVLLLSFALTSAYLLKGTKRVLSIGSICFIIWSISISQTRSAIVSMLVFGFILSVIGTSKSWRNLANYRSKVVFVILAILILAFGANLSYRYLNNTPQNIKAFFKSESSNRVQSSIEERLIIWKESIGIVKGSPILGVGPGNWQIHIAGAENHPNRVKSGRIVSNRVHNVYLEVWSESGSLGLLFYLSFVILSLGILGRLFSREPWDMVALFMGAGFIAFLSDQFFSFPNLQPTHIVLVAIFLGYINYRQSSVSITKIKPIPSRLFRLGSLVLCMIALYFYITFFFFEKNMVRAQKSKAMGDFGTALYYLDNASKSVHSIDRSGDSPELRKAIIYNQINKSEMSLEALSIAWKKNPSSPRIFATYGDAYSRQGDAKQAAVYYQKAFNVQSRNFNLGRNLAIAYFEEQEFQKCMDTMKKLNQKSVENDPKLFSMFTLLKIRSGITNK